jgi:hypothetical protein
MADTSLIFCYSFITLFSFNQDSYSRYSIYTMFLYIKHGMGNLMLLHSTVGKSMSPWP